MKTEVILQVEGYIPSEDYTYTEDFKNKELSSMSDEDLIEYAKTMYEDWNSTADPEDAREIKSVKKLTVVTKEKTLL